MTNSHDIFPENPERILVPVANPANAAALIDLALAIAAPHGSEVLVLFVSLGHTEREVEAVNTITALVEQRQSEDHTVELITHIASNAARGILDVAREENVDLVVLGVHLHSPERSVLGTVVETVVATAPCDVLIYRVIQQQATFTRVVVPVDGSFASRVAAQIGISIGHNYGVPVQAIYVQRSYRPSWEGWGKIEQTLSHLEGKEIVKRMVVNADNWAQGVLSRVETTDLIIVAASERSRMERWLYGDVSRDFLQKTPGPLILAARTIRPENGAGRLQKWLGRYNLTLAHFEQEEILWKASEMSSATIDYVMLALIATVIATLGLLLNSPAVIIGAMLVAPLMQPLIGFAAGIATGRIRMVGRALATLLQGILLILVVSTAISLMAPKIDFPTAEMLGRTNPTLLDAAVALASGVIGAYATARRDIPAALAGVAIAAALVPPLCTVGLYLGGGDIESAARAALLFLANIVCISLAGWLVFFWLGMRPEVTDTSRRAQYRSLALVTVLMLPVISALLVISDRGQDTLDIEDYLSENLGSAELVHLEVQPGDVVDVTATVQGVREPDEDQVAALQAGLAELLGHPVQLRLIFQKVIGPAEEGYLLRNRFTSNALSARGAW